MRFVWEDARWLSEESRRYLAEERALDNHYEQLWEEGRLGAFDRDFTEEDDPDYDVNALYEWSQGMRP